MTVEYYIPYKIQVKTAEVCRYLGGSADRFPEEVRTRIDEILSEAGRVLVPKLCYTVVPLSLDGDRIGFDGVTHVISRDLARNLSGCSHGILFCATVGAGVDRKIAANRLSPGKALIWDAVGTAGVEALCDSFCAEAPKDQKPRFSPGYGDLPLEFQRQLLAILDTDRRLGVSMTDSLLMTPTKSVSAILGVKL